MRKERDIININLNNLKEHSQEKLEDVYINKYNPVREDGKILKINFIIFEIF